MRLIHALALSAAVLMPIATPGVAQQANAAMIVVTGTGTVEAAPDIATLSIGVTTQGDTAAAALAANSAAVAAVMARLTASGIEARDMQTSNLSLFPVWSDPSVSTPQATVFSASNQLTVRVRSLDTLGVVLDAAVTDGANTLNGLTFGMSDPEPALDAARKEAVAAARVRAELLATAEGLKLGRIVTISEAGASTDPVPMFRADASASPVPVAGGELGLSASVTIQYELVE
ncbi:MAG: SIMPL domain-containing protein [Rhodobacterales bacterium]|nr:SIMPL domain-containing protein [Rhodobacterales bacterium]